MFASQDRENESILVFNSSFTYPSNAPTSITPLSGVSSADNTANVASRVEQTLAAERTQSGIGPAFQFWSICSKRDAGERLSVSILRFLEQPLCSALAVVHAVWMSPVCEGYSTIQTTDGMTTWKHISARNKIAVAAVVIHAERLSRHDCLQWKEFKPDSDSELRFSVGKLAAWENGHKSGSGTRAASSSIPMSRMVWCLVSSISTISIPAGKRQSLSDSKSSLQRSSRRGKKYFHVAEAMYVWADLRLSICRLNEISVARLLQC